MSWTIENDLGGGASDGHGLRTRVAWFGLFFGGWTAAGVYRSAVFSVSAEGFFCFPSSFSAEPVVWRFLLVTGRLVISNAASSGRIRGGDMPFTARGA